MKRIASLSFASTCALSTLFASCGAQGPGLSFSEVVGNLLSKTLPASNDDGRLHLADSHQSGEASRVAIARVAWGRLVDVYDTASTGEPRLQLADFLIGAEIPLSLDVVLEERTLAGVARVTIGHEIASAEFVETLLALEATLVDVLEKSADPSELPPFTAVPRNAALVVQFDDLIAAQTITSASLELRVGDAFAEPSAVRVLIDRHHGGWSERNGVPTFQPTRVILDPTVSEWEALGTTLTINELGLPPAASADRPNVALQLLASSAGIRNLAGNPLSGQGLGGRLVRAFRSGGAMDADNGFLPDRTPPSIVGEQSVSVGNLQSSGTIGEQSVVTLDLAFDTCAQAAARGDVLVAGGIRAEVLEPMELQGNELHGLRVTLAPGAELEVGEARYLSFYDPQNDSPECFVTFTSTEDESVKAPAQGVGTDVRLAVHFSEPVDASALESVEMSSAAGAAIVGALSMSGDRTELQFVPRVPLPHTLGQEEVYAVQVGAGVTDLAANALSVPITRVPFTLSGTQNGSAGGGFLLRFSSLDQDGDGKQDISGNFLIDLQKGVLRPRPVTRFSSVLDSLQPQVSTMVPLQAPVQTPHSNLGSKLQMVWRNIDLGLGLLDPLTWDLDVEGLAWAPFGGAVQTDIIREFEVRLAHSSALPDEGLSFQTLLPNWPLSGLATTYSDNVLASVQAAQKVVNRKQQGYAIQPIDAFIAATGTPMFPWPVADKPGATYTWRDTSAREVGAPNGAGANPEGFLQSTGPDIGVFIPDEVPTIGLPLLMEFRCFADAGPTAPNGLQVALAVNSSARPNFRAFSTGGIDQLGMAQIVDPDNSDVATGDFNSAGAQTTPADKVFAYGQVDFVVRVSRVHTRWFDTGIATGATFASPIVDVDLPSGTSFQLDYRGATDISGDFANALKVGAYGDTDATAQFPAISPVVPVFLNGDDSWHPQIADIDGAQHFQVRMTFVSNTQTGATPVLSGLGFAYTP